LFIALHAAILILSFFFKEYNYLVYASAIISVIMVLEKLGRGIVLREVIGLYNSFICLFMPLMGYLYYNANNKIAALFVRFMPISKETYFELALPAVTGFIVFLCWPLSKDNGDDGASLKKLIDNAKNSLIGNEKTGFILLGIGVLTSLVIQELPQFLQYLFTLLYFSSFAGLMYIYFAPRLPFKNTIMILFGIFILSNSLRNGMFTILAYMGMTLFSFFFLNIRAAMWKKIIVFSVSVFVLVIIQSVKSEYRRNILRTNKDNKASEFYELVKTRLNGQDNIISTDFMWPIYYRTNQGFYVALVQKYIPRSKPHDDGRNLFIGMASAFVPRLLWADKPMAGGIANMKYYTGYTIKGYTTNVGPLGEAYGSFGVRGGVIFMMALGAFIRFAYKKVFILSSKIPLLVFWLPVLFYEITYSAENDTLQIMNSLVKSAFFIFLIYKAFPHVLKPPKTGIMKQGNNINR
jgi:hypothetical protein